MDNGIWNYTKNFKENTKKLVALKVNTKLFFVVLCLYV